MKKLSILSILLLALSGLLFCASDYQVVKSFSLPKDKSFQGSLLSWRGKLDIQGHVQGSIILAGGNITLNGEIDEDVICIFADVKLNEKTLIKGDFYLIGGTFTQQPGSTIKGKFFNSKVDLKRIESTLLLLVTDSQTAVFIRAIKIIVWLIIALILFAIIPQKILKAEEIIQKNVSKITAIGILSMACLLVLLILFLILCIFIVGIPLLLILLIFYCVVCIFGRTVIFYYIGNRLGHFLKLTRLSPAFYVVIGALVYIVLKFIPYFGALFLFILNFFELGAGVGFIFRKKLKLESTLDIPLDIPLHSPSLQDESDCE